MTLVLATVAIGNRARQTKTPEIRINAATLIYLQLVLFFCAFLWHNFEAPLTLTHPTWTGMLIRAFQNRSAATTRWIGLLLTVFILYGTTVEAAHRHGRILPSNGAASLVDSDQTDSPFSSKSSCSDCLICQLHQNFGTALVAFRLVDPPKQVRITTADAVPLDSLSPLLGPTAGRAPPSIS